MIASFTICSSDMAMGVGYCLSEQLGRQKRGGWQVRLAATHI